MASLRISPIVAPSFNQSKRRLGSSQCHRGKHHESCSSLLFGKTFPNSVLNENRQLLTISKVATNEGVAKEAESNEKTHVAFTSVRQEKWQGELQVEGEIPQWLVCIMYYIECTFF